LDTEDQRYRAKERALGQVNSTPKPDRIRDDCRGIADLGRSRPLHVGYRVRKLQRLAPHPHFTPDVEGKQGETKDDENGPGRSPEALVSPDRIHELTIRPPPEGIHLIGQPASRRRIG